MTEPKYYCKIGNCPVGELYERVIVNGISFGENDIVVWSDPDANLRNPSVEEAVFVGYVNKIFKNDGPELGTTMPTFRLKASDIKARKGRGSEWDFKDNERWGKFIEDFENSNYTKYMLVERHRDGSIQVEGE